MDQKNTHSHNNNQAKKSTSLLSTVIDRQVSKGIKYLDHPTQLDKALKANLISYIIWLIVLLLGVINLLFFNAGFSGLITFVFVCIGGLGSAVTFNYLLLLKIIQKKNK